MTKVIIVDDHVLFRMGVKASFPPDIQIVGEAASGAELFRLLESTEADILLLDIILPDMSGVEIARRLKTERPQLKILAISAESTENIVAEMLETGINGFINKRMDGTAELVNAINHVMSGLEYFGRDISEMIYRIYVAKKHTAEVSSEFTAQEKRIIELCGEGLSSRLIADRLCISARTVDNHKTHIFEKLGLHSTVEMVEFGIKNGIIKLNS